MAEEYVNDDGSDRALTVQQVIDQLSALEDRSLPVIVDHHWAAGIEVRPEWTDPDDSTRKHRSYVVIHNTTEWMGEED